MKTLAKLADLRILARRVYHNCLSDEDRQVLALSLYQMGAGLDPKEAFDIKPKRGESVSPRAIHTERKRKMVMSFLWAATAPAEDEGLGLTIEAACELAAEHFGYSFDTLMTYYFRYSDELKPDFSLD